MKPNYDFIPFDGIEKTGVYESFSIAVLNGISSMLKSTCFDAMCNTFAFSFEVGYTDLYNILVRGIHDDYIYTYVVCPEIEDTRKKCIKVLIEDDSELKNRMYLGKFFNIFPKSSLMGIGVAIKNIDTCMDENILIKSYRLSRVIDGIETNTSLSEKERMDSKSCYTSVINNLLESVNDVVNVYVLVSDYTNSEFVVKIEFDKE